VAGNKKKLIVHIDDGEKVPDLCGLAIELINTENVNSKLISTALIIIDPTKESVKHYHKIMEEIYYITEGSGEIILDDKKFNINHGDSIFIPPLLKHQIKNTGSSSLKFISIDSPPYDEKDVYLSE
jgi:mannose-6-phosphate isomerase-like protein (cupin superfamily)